MHYVLYCILILLIVNFIYIVAENEPTTASQTGANQSQTGEDNSDGDSSGAPAIATGTIAAIAIIALIVIGVILGACYLRYNFYCKICMDILPCAWNNCDRVCKRTFHTHPLYTLQLWMRKSYDLEIC